MFQIYDGFLFEQFDLLSALKHYAKKSLMVFLFQYVLLTAHFVSQFTSVNIYCSIFNLVCLLLYSFWHQQKVYRTNMGLLLLWNPPASYIYLLSPAEKKKVEYVPTTGRESTNLFMMFSPKDQTCFPTGELVMEFRKLIQ